MNTITSNVSWGSSVMDPAHGPGRFKIELSGMLSFHEKCGVSIPEIREDIDALGLDLDNFLYEIRYCDFEPDPDAPGDYLPSNPDPEYLISDVHKALANISYSPAFGNFIISKVHDILYNDTAEDTVNHGRLNYLIDALSAASIVEIKDVGFGNNSPLQKNDLYVYQSPDLIAKIYKIATELGVESTGYYGLTIDELVDDICEYIQYQLYISDMFMFGNAILQKIDKYILPLDWFCHHELSEEG